MFVYVQSGVMRITICYSTRMKCGRIWLLIVVLPLIGCAGIGEWRYAHSTYPNPVLSEQATITDRLTFSPYGVFISHTERWIDPRAEIQRYQTENPFDGTGTNLANFRTGMQYDWSEGQAITSVSESSYSELAGMRSIMPGYRRYGPGSDGRHYLTRASGRIQHVLLNDRRALYFRIRPNDPMLVARPEIWLDARSLALLKIVFNYQGETIISTYPVPMHWLPSGSLPPDFFTPPHFSQSLWDQVQGWARDHISSRL